MHKAIFLEGTIALTITPNGPILVKAGESGGADPTLPDMEFVRTRRRGAPEIYIPGSSLKGVIRAQCERICRSLEQDGRDPQADNPPLADNPLGKGKSYNGLDDLDYNSGQFLDKESDAAIVYRRSALTSQIFGHTSLAGRVRFADAYAEGDVRVEERNGVAIDRIYGSVAVGPFNFETVVAGSFATTITLKNMTLAQIGLLGLALRDLADGRVALGFGKSRGLGRVAVNFDTFEVRYPTCTLAEGQLRLLNGQAAVDERVLAGVGALARKGYADYAFDAEDTAELPEGLSYAEDDDRGIGVRLAATGDAEVKALFKACMPAWRRRIGL
jgi:CRISPR-associated RAMP protein (TIGR02581 family)